MRVEPADVYRPQTQTALRTASGGMGGFGNLSFEEAQNFYKLEERHPELKTLKSIEEKRAFVASRRDALNREMADLDRDLEGQVERRERIEKNLAALTDISDWVDSGLKIERPDGISFRHLRKAVAEGQTLYLDRDVDSKTPAHDFEKEVFRFAEVLLIEHDWSAALQNDVANAVVKLPYEVCAFEFKFSGRAVIALATQLETDIAFTPAIQHDGRWLLTGFVTPASGYVKSNDGWVKLFNTLGSQIRAACIALDAEVARSEVAREPYNAAHGRNSHQTLKPYHVVSLAHRHARPLAAAGVESGRRVRLHFRRGHWRHFEAHKTWIKWMLVGDPDLGFVDKHYRL